MLVNERIVDELTMAIKPLSDNESKIRYIWDITRSSNLSLSPYDYHEWIKRVVATTRDALTVPFCKDLVEYWGDRGMVSSYRGFRNLAHGVVLCLTDCLVADKKDGLNDTIMSMFFGTAIFYCQRLIGNEGTGAAQRLLRLFGEMASVELYCRLAKEELADPDMPKELKDAIAEGVVKHTGADLVLKIFLGTTGANTGRDRTEEIEACWAELRELCANRGTDVASTLTRRDTLLTILGNLMGEEAAQKQFADEFPDMVTQPE